MPDFNSRIWFVKLNFISDESLMLKTITFILFYLSNIANLFAQSRITILESRRSQKIIKIDSGDFTKGMILNISDNDSQNSQVKVLNVSKSGKVLLVEDYQETPMEKVCYFQCVVDSIFKGEVVKPIVVIEKIVENDLLKPVQNTKKKNYFGVNWGIVNNFDEESGNIETKVQYDLLLNGYFERDLIYFSMVSISTGFGFIFGKNQISNLPNSYLFQPNVFLNLNLSIDEKFRFFVGGNINYAITTDLQYVENGNTFSEQYDNALGIGFQTGLYVKFAPFFAQLMLQSNSYNKLGKESVSQSENIISTNLSTISIGIGFNF